ncbi:LuxR C-terminal-related transcriptional regulator [Slackia sp.]|nr:LuxR C-terminal-related transcriptional regulator [Slackia sp.]MEE0519326.1 LuxR C-terminal-related transcriptional regulator [Slackia sp.]
MHDAEKLKEEFGLSDREAEAITLYALGKTQQAIAEDLCITPATVRVHI